jgi:crotonobetaine/carnitine-CoA ligase
VLSDLVAQRARDHARDPFCYFEDQVITFGDLARRAAAAAEAMIAGGIRPGDRVAVMMGNHPYHIYDLVALAAVGAVHVPVNLHHKASGIRHVIDDAEISVVRTEDPYEDEVSKATGGHSRAITIETLDDYRQASPESETSISDFSSGNPDRLAMILYTSGTTGPQKGVPVTDRMYQTAAKNAGVAADVRPGDVMFLWEPLYHVAGVQTIILSLQQGIPCAMVERFSASQFWNQVRRYRATQIHYLGGVLGLLLKQPERPDDADNPVRIAYGAPAPPELWVRFEKRFGVKIRECYGMTEASSFTTINLDGKVGSIGKPVPEFEVRIVDDNDKPVPAGTVGEIVQREKVPGALMRGYLNNAESTRIALRGGWLHTGDLGYCDDQGYFYFSGRKKDTIRCKGENVSAWVVEQAAGGFPGVEECAAVGVPSEHGEEDIKLFVRQAAGISVDPGALVKWCEERLARFEVPRYVAFIEAFPKTPSERIRKGELSRDTDCWDRE